MSVAGSDRRIANVPPGHARALARNIGMTKIFGPLVALGDVSIKVEAGTVPRAARRERRRQVDARQMHHGLLFGRSRPGLLDGKEVPIRNPRDARALGIGMVYQHFTLVPSLTGAENLVISRADAPAVIDWKKEMALARGISRSHAVPRAARRSGLDAWPPARSRSWKS
jgi:ABC-type branched-subunit amino acid transport system ATPase component